MRSYCEDAAEGGIDHHRDHGDDADRDQGEAVRQIPHKVSRSSYHSSSAQAPDS